MVVEEILERNRTFARGRTPVPFPAASAARLAVVACYDPRIDGLLREGLGLDPGSAFLLRAAGAYVAPAGDPIRSLAVSVYLFGIAEVLIVGHTTCRMAEFRASEFADAFRRRGVPREAFGDSDLRSWTGAIADPRRGVLASVAVLRAAPVLPRDLRVTGVVLDDTTGALEVVVGAEDPVPGSVPAPRDATEAREPGGAAAEPFAASPVPTASPLQTASPGQTASPARTASPEPPRRTPGEPAARAQDAVQSALHFIGTLRSKATLRDEAMRLRLELGTTKNPFEKLRLVEAFLRRAGGDAREVRAAVDDVRRRAAQAPAAEIADEVARRVSELARED